MKYNTAFLPTAVGSLPHTNQEDAINLVFNSFKEIPVIAQLANVNPMEDMMSQFNQNIPGVIFDEQDCRWYIDQESETFCDELEEFFMDYESIVNDGELDLLEKYAISNDFCSSMPLFLEKLKETKPEFVKGQIVGPFTYTTSLVDRDKKCAIYDETLREICIKALTLKALWILKQYKEVSPDSKPIIFMDEPTISQYGTSAFLTIKRADIVNSIKEIASVLQKHGAIVGVHCCGKSDWELITESEVDILNFDGFYYAESLGLYINQIQSFLNKGGKIAWGLVPTMDVDALESATIDSLIKKYEEAIAYLTSKGINKEQIFEASLITPTCGAGSISVKQAELAMRLTSELGYALKNKFQTCIGNK